MSGSIKFEFIHNELRFGHRIYRLKRNYCFSKYYMCKTVPKCYASISINNRVEGDNTKMKSYCGAADPKIHKACHLLRLYESTAFDKYYNAKKPNSKQARVRLEDRLKEERFKEMKALLSNEDIEFEV